MIKQLWCQLVGLPYRPKVNFKLPNQTKKGDKLSERDLIAREAEIGSEIFGPVPEGHKRMFFCLDEHTWVWHESWTESDQPYEITVRYKIHGDKVLKTSGGVDSYLEGYELANFKNAAKRYTELVARDIYSQPYEQQPA